jgi:hypothetical protein
MHHIFAKHILLIIASIVQHKPVASFKDHYLQLSTVRLTFNQNQLLQGNLQCYVIWVTSHLSQPRITKPDVKGQFEC